MKDSLASLFVDWVIVWHCLLLRTSCYGNCVERSARAAEKPAVVHNHPELKCPWLLHSSHLLFGRERNEVLMGYFLWRATSWGIEVERVGSTWQDMAKLTTSQIRTRASELISEGFEAHGSVASLIQSESPETPINTIRTQVWQVRAWQGLSGTRTARAASSKVTRVLVPTMPSTTGTLVELGFELIGLCRPFESRFECAIGEHGQKSPAIYAFVLNDEVMYIGKTKQTLDRRLQFYAKPGPRQSTNIRVNAEILRAHGDGAKIDIYALLKWEYLEHCGIPINVAAGIEDELIKRIRPAWNAR